MVVVVGVVADFVDDQGRVDCLEEFRNPVAKLIDRMCVNFVQIRSSGKAISRDIMNFDIYN